MAITFGAALLTVGYLLLTREGATELSIAQLKEGESPPVSASAAVGSDAPTNASSSAPVIGHTIVTPSVPATHTVTGSSTRFPMPELTQALREPARFNIGERSWAVLGTRVVPGAAGTVNTLVLRDESSGQLEYRQSALRFVLQDGQNYEAFINSVPNATRLFVNSMYGDIAVDASRIADTYTALAQNPNVRKLMFIPLEVKAVPK